MDESFKLIYDKFKIEQWNDKYINFNLLFELINGNKIINEDKIDEKENDTSIKERFKTILNKEFKKFYLFFIDQERELYLEINQILHKKNYYKSLSNEKILSEFNKLNNIAFSTTKLVSYIYINTLIIDQILQEYDKRFENKIYSEYIIEILDSSNSDLGYILKYKLLNEITSIIDYLKDELKNCFNKNNIEDISNNNNELIQNNKNQLNENNILQVYETNVVNILYQIEIFYKKTNSFHKKWNRMIKDKKNLLSENNSKNDILSFFSNIISKDNKYNIYISIFQTWYILFSYTLIYSNLFFLLKNTNNKLCGLIIGITFLGKLFSYCIMIFWVKKSYKLPMIFSSIIYIIGHLLFYFGVKNKQIIFLFISRFLFGISSTIYVNKNYIIYFIPKRKISPYLFSLKLFSIIGMICGPLVILLCYFLEKIEFIKNSIYLNDNKIASILGIFFGIIELCIILIFYLEPVDKNFKIYKEGRDPQNLLSKNHFLSLNDQMTYFESKTLKLIDDKLFQFNYENQYNDTNLVDQIIQELVFKEIGPFGNVKIAFFLIIFNIIFLSFDINYFLIEIPYLKINQLSIIIFFIVIFFVYLLIYYIHLKFSRNCLKINYLLILSIIFLILGIILIIFKIINVFEIMRIGSLYFFPIIISCIIIISYILIEQVFYFFTEIIPTDFRILGFKALTFVYILNNLGEILGCFINFILNRYDSDPIVKLVFYFINIFFFILFIVCFYIKYDQFKYKPIRRILNSKNSRKIKRTEF